MKVMRKKIIKITESQIIDTVKKVINEHYELSCLDELMEYMWIRPKYTGLNVDIFVDDGGSYLRNQHPLLVFARNGYDKSVNDFIPFLVSERPVILKEYDEYGISYNDIFAIQYFIISNIEILKGLANDKISQTEFFDYIKIPEYVIAEDKKLINEMATLRAKDSGLPMDIWLDEGSTYIGHAPRLKFKASVEQRTTREYSSMLLTNPPTTENVPQDSPITKKDLDKLKSFVVNNLDLLLKLCNGEIEYKTQFLPNVKF